MDLIIPTISQGLLWALLAIGVYLTFRVLDIADLTVEGSFPLGAATAASFLAAGTPPLLAIGAAFAAGMVSGVITGLLTTKLKIPTMIALYSVNLRIMGKANLPLLNTETIFTQAQSLGLTRELSLLAMGFLVVVLISVACYYFFGTELGAAIRATGDNPHMIRANGVNTDMTIILGLLLSNGLVAISGALVAQANGFADVGMGVGTIVIGLASVIIGEVLFGTRSFKNCLLAVIGGSIVYRAVIAIVLELGMPPNDLKLFTAALVALALSLPLIQARIRRAKGGLR